jgi:hypothetical protein
MNERNYAAWLVGHFRNCAPKLMLRRAQSASGYQADGRPRLLRRHRLCQSAVGEAGACIGSSKPVRAGPRHRRPGHRLA